MNTFNQLISTFSEDNKTRGTEIEVLCKWILETDPVYANTLTDVWMWSDWPERWDDQDLGIDLIAKDTEGKIWAIQAKCYKPENSINKGDIDSFIAYSSHPKIDVRLLIATTDKVASTAVRTMQLSHELKPVQPLLLAELLRQQIVWPTSINDLSGGG